MEIIIIAAMAENRVIGKNNRLPWSIKEDIIRFRNLTKGFPCIMGRKTWESLPKKPLPERLNIVISKTMPELDNIKIFPSLSAAVEFCAGHEKIFICGGQAIYSEALTLANKIELTVIHSRYEGDAFFPEIDMSCWEISNTISFDTLSFMTYTKKKGDI